MSLFTMCKGFRASYLHDNEFKDQWQLTDVTRGQVKEKRSVPDGVRTTDSFGLLGTDHFPILTQVDDNIVVCKTRSGFFFYVYGIFFYLGNKH